MRIRFGSRQAGQHSRGGSLLFALIFMGAGGWMLHRAFLEHQGGSDLQVIGLYAVMGAVFVITGLSSLRAGRRARQEQDRVEDLRAAHPDEPWMVRPEWHDGRFEAERSGSTNNMLFAVLWNVFTWPLAIFAISSELGSPDPDRAVYLVLLFPLVGIFFAWSAIRGILARRKFGRTVLELDTLPVPLGGRLQGRVMTGIQPRDAPPEGFHVKLSCYRRRVVRESSSDGKSKRRVELKLLWRDEKRMTGISSDANTRLGVPVVFDLPDDRPESTAERTPDRIAWRIELSAEVPGLDYEASIEIPVFDLGPQASGVAAESGPAVDDYSAYELREERRGPTSPGIELRTPSPDRTEFFFDRARDKSTILITGLVALGCLGTMVGMIMFGEGVGFFAFLILALLTAAFGYVAYRAWSYTSTLIVGPDRIELVRGPFGRGNPVLIPTAELADVTLDIGGTSGSGAKSKASYKLTILRLASEQDRELQREGARKIAAIADGLGVSDDEGRSISERLAEAPDIETTKVVVADGLKDKAEADWIVERIRAAAAGTAR